MTPDIEQARQQAEYGIGSFKSNLDQYAAKPNANTEYYQSRVQALADIRTYVLMLEYMLIEIETERQNAYRTGYQAGYAKVEKEQQYNGSGSYRELRMKNREGARDVSIRNAQQNWPNLY